jgi:CRISPR-associated endonuclease/helicase Cas3
MDRHFKTLTEFSPLSWQTRLFSEYFKNGELPAAVDIPTGLGKTAVMALWLIARASGAQLPRRLVYVVDRRAVVDQATEFAVSLRKSLDSPEAADLKKALGLGNRSLPISTLRGQFVDNREWLEDPASTAIVVGTVDMIGSRLLFEGYGVSRKMRPYHAGLLGADTLVVLDEAHLVPPFERLLEAIEQGSERFGARANTDRTLIPPFRLLSLSATGRERAGTVFRLEEKDIKQDRTVERRLDARKLVKIMAVGAQKLEEALATHAWALADEGKSPIRCLVFCDQRETAENTKREIEALAKAGSNRRPQAVEIHPPELLVGARRVFERVDATDNLRELGFIAGSGVTLEKPAFLIATSAGEVGIDLDADQMVCDLVAWERMVQRLGRVNRRGERQARIVVVDQGEPEPKKADAATAEEASRIERHRAVSTLVRTLPKSESDSFLASPGALRNVKASAASSEQLRKLIERATSPVPLRPALTRALVDAWSMTSLEEHTGRPEVQPWIRGWIDDEPQTTVIWRAQLPVRVGGSRATHKEIEAFFEAAPPHASELLETETWRVSDWLMKRAETLVTRISGSGREEPDLEREASEGAAEPASDHQRPLKQNDVVAFALSSAGDLIRPPLFLRELIAVDAKATKKLTESLKRQLQGVTLIVDARLAGLRDGLLNEEADDVPRTADDGGDWIVPTNTQLSHKKDASSQPVIRFRVRSIRAGQETEDDRNWRERLRLEVERTDDGEAVRLLVVEKWRHDAATEEDRSAGWPQELEEHQSWTEEKARLLSQRVGLQSPYVEMLCCAASLHDEGKRADRWQRAFNAPRGKVFAKTKGPLNQALLDGYRHEFGSLPRAEADTAFQALPPEMRELVLHLIAAHHGQARPVISTRSCEDAPPSALEERARDVALRFARLQTLWGPWGLAWWEALLRAADQQASRDNDAREGAKTKEGG